MAAAKKKKAGRKVHIDNLHLVKKMEPEYADAFFSLEETLLREGYSADEINIIANTAIDQLMDGMAKKKKPSLIIPKEKNYRSYLSRVSHGQGYKETKKKLCRQDYEKFTISGIWLVFCICILLLFFKNLITGMYLINFSIDLIAGALALLLAVRNYQVRWRVIRRYENPSFYCSVDLITLLLCIVIKLLVKGNFDISYLLLVIAYFMTKRKFKQQIQAAAEN